MTLRFSYQRPRRVVVVATMASIRAGSRVAWCRARSSLMGVLARSVGARRARWSRLSVRLAGSRMVPVNGVLMPMLVPVYPLSVRVGGPLRSGAVQGREGVGAGGGQVVHAAGLDRGHSDREAGGVDEDPGRSCHA